MLQLVAAMRRKILKFTTRRVIDESTLGNGEDQPGEDVRSGAILYRIVRAPLSLLSCVSSHQINGVDGGYEVNYLMVRDSMRYAIYV